MTSQEYRTPIVAVLGHVDHGKTTLLDEVRGSAVATEEDGKITQHIGATSVPLENIAADTDTLLNEDDFDLPGLLFIDTPGHRAFTSLRSRGGALADIAILVVDINDGVQPQTKEAINILRETETPFVVAANKVDKLPNWRSNPEHPVQETLYDQSDRVQSSFNQSVYEIIGEFSDYNITSDLFWQVDDFRKTVGVVPTSAQTGEGVSSLLAVLMGLAQQYMKNQMEINVEGAGKGTVVEVNEQQGFGTTMDILLYDGSLNNNDTIVVGGRDGSIETDVRQLLQPKSLRDSRVTTEFQPVETVSAAAGVRVAAPMTEEVVSGAPFRVATEQSDAHDAVAEELADIEITTDTDGIVAKADTLGSLEALVSTLREEDINIMRAEVGDISPRDISVASTAGDMAEQAIVGFNVERVEDAVQEANDQDVQIFTHSIIYQLLDSYQKYVEEIESAREEEKLEDLVRPARIQVLQDHVFNRREPAIVGVEVLAGHLKAGVPLTRRQGGDDVFIGRVSRMEDAGEAIRKAHEGDKVSLSISDAAVGRDFSEGDMLWTRIPEEDAKSLETEFNSELTVGEREVLKNYVKRQRKSSPFWGK